MRSRLRRLVWRPLTTDFGNFLVSWVATWPLALYLRYVTRSPSWLHLTAVTALYLCVRRALPPEAEARRRLAHLDAQARHDAR